MALEAIHEEKTIEEISKHYNINRLQVTLWKKELLDGAESIFIDKRKTESSLTK